MPNIAAPVSNPLAVSYGDISPLDATLAAQGGSGCGGGLLAFRGGRLVGALELSAGAIPGIGGMVRLSDLLGALEGVDGWRIVPSAAIYVNSSAGEILPAALNSVTVASGANGNFGAVPESYLDSLGVGLLAGTNTIGRVENVESSTAVYPGILSVSGTTALPPGNGIATQGCPSIYALVLTSGSMQGKWQRSFDGTTWVDAKWMIDGGMAENPQTNTTTVSAGQLMKVEAGPCNFVRWQPSATAAGTGSLQIYGGRGFVAADPLIPTVSDSSANALRVAHSAPGRLWNILTGPPRFHPDYWGQYQAGSPIASVNLDGTFRNLISVNSGMLALQSNQAADLKVLRLFVSALGDASGGDLLTLRDPAGSGTDLWSGPIVAGLNTISFANERVTLTGGQALMAKVGSSATVKGSLTAASHF